MGSVEVAVPATSANLGPGFDCLGVALGTHLRVRFSSSDRSEITGKGRHKSPEDSLIFRSFEAAFKAADSKPSPVAIEVLGDYPSGRGLGASASAIVAGLVGGTALSGLTLQTEDLAKLAIQIEGHPDNVLPALLGGLILSVGERWIRFEPSGTIAPMILVAAGSFKTKAARKVLPQTAGIRDAVANVSSAAALVSVLSGQSDPSFLFDATRDRLHEPYRLPLMPESLQLHRSLRDRGIATTLSGAGPSLVCLVHADRLQESARTVEGMLPEGWAISLPGWDLEGARIS